MIANQWTFVENSRKRPDILLFLNLTQCQHLIPDSDGFFKFKIFTGLIHFRHQIVKQLLILPLKKKGYQLHLPLILLVTAYPRNTGSKTPADLIHKTRSGPVAVNGIVTLSYGKQLLHKLQSLSHGSGTRIGTEIRPLLLFGSPVRADTGMPVSRQQNKRIGFVIL